MPSDRAYVVPKVWAWTRLDVPAEEAMSNRWLWIEEYHGCGCSSDAPRKRDLLGYCNLHGGNRKRVYKVPGGKR